MAKTTDDGYVVMATEEYERLTALEDRASRLEERLREIVTILVGSSIAFGSLESVLDRLDSKKRTS